MPRLNRKPAPAPIEIAPIEIRNAVYQELIRRSPALKYYSQLIDGPNGLLSRTVIITEGALKAQTLVSLRPKACVIATSGVSCSHEEIINAARAYNALIAFDADYKTNPAVARQLARLIAAREQDIAAHQLSTSTRIVFWRRYKGIDDAILANTALETMTILQWISTLGGRPLQEVWGVWEQMSYTPTPGTSATGFASDTPRRELKTIQTRYITDQQLKEMSRGPLSPHYS